MGVRIKRLDHVQVCVPRGGESAAREFYGGVLGLRELERPEALRARGGLWFEVADVQLHVGVEDEAAPPSPKRHAAFEVEDVPGARRYLEARGVQTRDEPDLPGVRRFSFFDPFGNRIEFMERV